MSSSRKEFLFSSGIGLEVDAFAASIEAGKLDPRLTSEAALTDVSAMQDMLVSGEEKGSVKSIS